MKQYIIELTRNMGIGKDIVNYFEKRGCRVAYKNPEILPKTIIVETNSSIEEIRALKYVSDVKEAPVGRLCE